MSEKDVEYERFCATYELERIVEEMIDELPEEERSHIISESEQLFVKDIKKSFYPKYNNSSLSEILDAYASDPVCEGYDHLYCVLHTSKYSYIEGHSIYDIISILHKKLDDAILEKASDYENSSEDDFNEIDTEWANFDFSELSFCTGGSVVTMIDGDCFVVLGDIRKGSVSLGDKLEFVCRSGKINEVIVTELRKNFNPPEMDDEPVDIRRVQTLRQGDKCITMFLENKDMNEFHCPIEGNDSALGYFRKKI